MEREAVVDERDLVQDALKRSMGQATFADVRADLDARIRDGEFLIAAKGKCGHAGRLITTREMFDLEQGIRKAASKSGSTQGAMFASTSATIRIWITATRSQATAARGRRPTGFLCMSIRKPSIRLCSIRVLPMFPFLALVLTLRSGPTTPALSVVP